MRDDLHVDWLATIADARVSDELLAAVLAPNITEIREQVRAHLARRRDEPSGETTGAQIVEAWRDAHDRGSYVWQDGIPDLIARIDAALTDRRPEGRRDE